MSKSNFHFAGNEVANDLWSLFVALEAFGSLIFQFENNVLEGDKLDVGTWRFLDNASEYLAKPKQAITCTIL